MPPNRQDEVTIITRGKYFSQSEPQEVFLNSSYCQKQCQSSIKAI